MSRIKKCTMLCFTALIIESGLLLPEMVFKIQEKRLEGRISTYKTDPVKLTFAEQILDKMRVFSEAYTMVEVSSETNLDEKTAYEAACSILEFYEEHNFKMLDFLQIRDHKEQPFLVNSSHYRETVLVWQCFIFDQEGKNVTLFLDDETGKLLWMEYYGNDYHEADNLEKDFVAVTEKYYDIEMNISEQKWAKEMEGDISYYDIEIGGEIEKPVWFQLIISKDMILFIPGWK